MDSSPVRDPRKVLLINIPQVPADIFSHETAVLNGYHIYPPIGYLYLVAAAKQANPDLQFSILDLNYQMFRLCHFNLLQGHEHDFRRDLIA